MPEGPSIVILKEEASIFIGKKVLAVEGNTKTIDKNLLLNKTIVDFKSWGKHFLICLKGFTIRIHFLLFGSYRINEPKDSPVRLGLKFTNGTLHFYACSVKMLEGDLNPLYDWKTDVMSDKWDPAEAKRRLKTIPNALVCDALLNQTIFAGVGNIIKNEVLYRIKVHPASTVGKLSAIKLNQLIKEARNYSFDFLQWKKKYVLKKHWLVHTKKTCANCSGPVVKQYLGNTNRRTFFCPKCQKLHV
jgi:endonuclease VIII